MNRELTVTVMPDGAIQPEWINTEDAADPQTISIEEQIYRNHQNNPDRWLLHLGLGDQTPGLSPSLHFWRSFSAGFIRNLSKMPDLETLRHHARLPPPDQDLQQFLENAPMMTGAEYLNLQVLASVWAQLNRSFADMIKDFNGTVEEFMQSHRPDVHIAGRVYFHLVENKDASRPFAFLATYATRVDEKGKSKHLPLKNALEEYGTDRDKLLNLLTTVYRAAQKSRLVEGLVESGELFHPLAWTANEAFTFLKEVSLYETAGILCRIPNWWKNASSGFGVQISVGDKQPSFVGMDAILDFNVRLLLDGMEITEEEARQLLETSQGLAFIKNRWVAADPEKIKKTLEAYKKAKIMMKEEGLTLRDALRMQLHPQSWMADMQDDDARAGAVGISNGEWLKSVTSKLLNPADIEPVNPGKKFKADLRPYQEKGLNWLWFHHNLRFGACLADDMGLGKTIQLLAFLSVMKSSSKTKPPASLLVIPASLIANWMHEIKRFSPHLTVYVAHPEVHKSKKITAKTGSHLDKLDLVITTYALAQRYEWLKTYEWSYVILDEAQAIKNPGTKQTRAVKSLNARNRIILTGTPVENRLGDLWSLFDFLNPGLLGTSKEFGKFSKNMKDDNTGYARLRKVISPYILRRLKTDKSVISDLPDKVEMKTYASLSKNQLILYQSLIKDIEKTIAETDGIQRKGLILASLMKFKQICNHPDQYMGTGDFLEAHSGKFARLREICETIYEKRERVLVFTQFKEMTAPLDDFLSGIFERSGLVLHGSVAVGKRKKLIDQFQQSAYTPYMVLSLKAGGVGLNLTAANHVIHFDRWWNPAVENQATDRAFRIGQKKNVMVHKFLTRGTVEEKIDLMLEEKSRMSSEVVAATGESWITEMKNNAVMDLFKLSL